MSNDSLEKSIISNPSTIHLVGSTKIMNDTRINELCTNGKIFILKQTKCGFSTSSKIYHSTTNKWNMYDFIDNLLCNTHYNLTVSNIINTAVDCGISAFVTPDHGEYELAVTNNLPMIVDHSHIQVTEKNGEKVISYGTSSYGYDIRVDNKFKKYITPRLSNGNESIAIDPKNIPTEIIDTYSETKNYTIIPPNSFVLANTVESFNIPPNVLVTCIGKSTYARCGKICIVTPLEPGWSGHLTLEFSNTTQRPIKMYLYEGVAQLIFHESTHLPNTTYADRGGKYQNQDREPIIPRLK